MATNKTLIIGYNGTAEYQIIAPISDTGGVITQLIGPTAPDVNTTSIIIDNISNQTLTGNKIFDGTATLNLPVIPSVYVLSGSTQSVGSNNVQISVGTTATLYDPYGMFELSTSSITIPAGKSGIYSITMSIYEGSNGYNGGAVSNVRVISVSKNDSSGTTHIHEDNKIPTPSGTVGNFHNATWTSYLTSGDVLRFWVYQTSGSNQTYGNADALGTNDDQKNAISVMLIST